MKNDYLITENPLKCPHRFRYPHDHRQSLSAGIYHGGFSNRGAVSRRKGILAAVGAAYSLTNIFICVAIGGGMGASVIVSQYFGHGNYGKLRKRCIQRWWTFLVISVMLGVIGLAFSKNIMIAMNTPVEVLDMSVTYLQIYFLGLPFLFMYNVLSSMFNALGKSRIPLYFLIFSSVFNIVLDWVFVADFALDVAGVAWATLIAQGVSVLGSFTVLRKELKKLEGASDGIFEAEELLPMAKIALPSILQQSTVSIGMMLVQSVVNSFGAESLAGFSAGDADRVHLCRAHGGSGQRHFLVHGTEYRRGTVEAGKQRLRAGQQNGHILRRSDLRDSGTVSDTVYHSVSRRGWQSGRDCHWLWVSGVHGIFLLHDRF